MLILLVRANALRRRPPTIPPPRRQAHHCNTNASSGPDTKAAGAPKATTAATPTTATSDKANGHPHRHRNHRYNWHASPGRIRSHRDSPKAASTEVLISPPRPRYIIAALGSSSRYVGGFLHATQDGPPGRQLLAASRRMSPPRRKKRSQHSLARILSASEPSSWAGRALGASNPQSRDSAIPP
jgi:hypothetical protein